MTVNSTTSATSKTIVGVFDSHSTAERAAEDLIQNGFSRNDVRITDATNWSGGSDADNSGGGISGFFRRLFGAGEEEDTKYRLAVQEGRAVVSVRADESRMEGARDLFERYDPIDIDIDDDASPHRPDAHNLTGSDSERSIPVIDEKLQVGKRSVERGGVRVYSHVVDQPVEEQVALREERVKVVRRPADRPATDADFHPPDQVIEVKETREEPVISKQARVREEVVLQKEAHIRTETIRDTVRRTDVNVEQLDSDKVSDNFDTDFRSDFAERYSSVRGASYDTYAPAYRYGYSSASEEKYRGRSWEDVQDTLKTDYLRRNPNSRWDQVHGAIRYGWEKVTRQR